MKDVPAITDKSAIVDNLKINSEVTWRLQIGNWTRDLSGSKPKLVAIQPIIWSGNNAYDQIDGVPVTNFVLGFILIPL